MAIEEAVPAGVVDDRDSLHLPQRRRGTAIGVNDVAARIDGMAQHAAAVRPAAGARGDAAAALPHEEDVVDAGGPQRIGQPYPARTAGAAFRSAGCAVRLVVTPRRRSVPSHLTG